MIGCKFARNAAEALPQVAHREEQLKALVEINRERLKEKRRLKELFEEEEEEEEEEWRGAVVCFLDDNPLEG